MDNLIKQLVIVGGGSAGWMTAAMLSKQLGPSVKITLIESQEIGTVGVGEATIPPIKNFNRLLGIDETEFLSVCNGSIKLGIEFENWLKKGHTYMHPFGSFAIDFDYMPFPYYWLKANHLGDKRPLQQFSIAWHLAKNNKFMQPTSNAAQLESKFDYAYHFDAGLYAKFLRKIAESHGVERKEGKITRVQQTPNNFISSVTLENGDTISADFFIDCSGQKALLLTETLNVEMLDWSQYLLNDSAIAIQSAHVSNLNPYTRSIAHESGWQWRIPLQTRMGNGNVYSSEFMNDDDALELLLGSLAGPTLTEPNLIKFQTGRKQQSWKHNCVAIGLSAGFLEPLESTSLHLIQSAIMRLIRLFPDKNCSLQLQQAFNQATQKEYEDIRDFIVLHYKATERDDSPYWQACKEMTVPDSLSNRIELFKEHGHLIIHDKALFKQENWLAVLTGQGILPQTVTPILAGKNNIDLSATLNNLEKSMANITSSTVSHEMYLAKHCPHSG